MLRLKRPRLASEVCTWGFVPSGSFGFVLLVLYKLVLSFRRTNITNSRHDDEQKLPYNETLVDHAQSLWRNVSRSRRGDWGGVDIRNGH